jgi:FkbM family methyltransferase
LLAAFDAPARVALHEEIAITAILAGALRPGAGYVDVGANRGQILEQAVRLAPGGEHVAFEPIPLLAGELAQAFPSVDCRRMALGAEPQTTEFCYFRKLEGWSGLRRSPEISDERGEPEYITVEVSTLDRELGDAAPRVIKIDVEGAELQVLQGGRSLLARARPLVIFEHVAAAAALYGSSPEELFDLLSELGYEILSVTGAGPLDRRAFAAGGENVNWLARPVS